jgi:hypothetical protein
VSGVQEPLVHTVTHRNVKTSERFVDELRRELRAMARDDRRRSAVRAALGAACIMRDLLLAGDAGVGYREPSSDSAIVRGESEVTP